MLTAAGEELVGHARRILAAHRDAMLSMKGTRADGRVALGCTQDYADSGLPGLLRIFARTHPRVRIDLRVGRSAELAGAFDEGAVDLVIVMRQGAAQGEVAVLREPMVWLAAAAGLAAAETEIPVALLDPPCGFRSAAIAALDAARRPYRIAATSASLSGVKAAVRSGIAVTARTRRLLEPGIVPAPQALDLPDLPDAEFTLRLGADAGASAHHLAELLAEGLPASQRAEA